MSLSIDPWADGPLEDQPAPRPTWTRQALDEMAASIRSQLTDSRLDDPELVLDLARKTVHELQRRAPVDPWAAGLLETLWHRAESRVPYSWSEPVEPADSLDSDRTVWR